MSVVDTATRILKAEEGFSERVYIDTEGYPTVGYGIKVGYKGQDLSEYRDFPPISKELGNVWLSDHLCAVVRGILGDDDLAYFSTLSEVRGAVVLSMCYQLGISGFKKFKKTNKYLREGDFSLAAMEMMDSLWAEQTKLRAKRHSRMMENNVLLEYYL